MDVFEGFDVLEKTGKCQYCGRPVVGVNLAHYRECPSIPDNDRDFMNRLDRAIREHRQEILQQLGLSGAMN